MINDVQQGQELGGGFLVAVGDVLHCAVSETVMVAAVCSSVVGVVTIAVGGQHVVEVEHSDVVERV